MNSRLPKFYKHLGCKPIPSGVQRELAEWTPTFRSFLRIVPSPSSKDADSPKRQLFHVEQVQPDWISRLWVDPVTIVPCGTGSIGHADTKLHDNGKMYLMYAPNSRLQDCDGARIGQGIFHRINSSNSTRIHSAND